MCPPDSPAVRDAHLYPSPSPQHPLPLPFAPLPDSSLASFIHDPSSHMDPCLSPHMQHFHASTSWYYPRQSLMLPYWVPGTWGGLGDVGTVMVEHGEWKNWDRHLDGGKPWELRKENKAYWRGQTSGNVRFFSVVSCSSNDAIRRSGRCTDLGTPRTEHAYTRSRIGRPEVKHCYRPARKTVSKYRTYCGRRRMGTLSTRG